MKNKFGALFQRRITVYGTISEIHTSIVKEYVRDFQKEYMAEDMAAEKYRNRTWVGSSYASEEYDESNVEMRMAYENELQRMADDTFNGLAIREDENGHPYPVIIPPVYRYRLVIVYNISDVEYKAEHCITSRTSLTFSEIRIRVDMRDPGSPIDIVVR